MFTPYRRQGGREKFICVIVVGVSCSERSRTISNNQADILGNWKYVTPDTTMYGLYYTIWKRQTDGKWKWSVDGGNNMPGEFKIN
jgi:hypothetical protein